jgi:hypothetical protein
MEMGGGNATEKAFTRGTDGTTTATRLNVKSNAANMGNASAAFSQNRGSLPPSKGGARGSESLGQGSQKDVKLPNIRQ